MLYPLSNAIFVYADVPLTAVLGKEILGGMQARLLAFLQISAK